LGSAAAFGAALLPFFLMTAARTGYPLSPLPVRVGPLVLGVAPPEVEWYMDRAFPAYEPLAELGVLRQVFMPPGILTEALGLFTLLPLLASLRGFGALRRKGRGALALLLLVAGVD